MKSDSLQLLSSDIRSANFVNETHSFLTCEKSQWLVVASILRWRSNGSFGTPSIAASRVEDSRLEMLCVSFQRTRPRRISLSAAANNDTHIQLASKRAQPSCWTLRHGLVINVYTTCSTGIRSVVTIVPIQRPWQEPVRTHARTRGGTEGALGAAEMGEGSREDMDGEKQSASRRKCWPAVECRLTNDRV